MTRVTGPNAPLNGVHNMQAPRYPKSTTPIARVAKKVGNSAPFNRTEIRRTAMRERDVGYVPSGLHPSI